MRRIKKIFVTFLAICMICPCLSVITEAATAELRFADPSTTVGAEVDVKTKLTSASSMQSMEATLTYDKSELRFISGDNATGKDGTIKISWTGTGFFICSEAREGCAHSKRLSIPKHREPSLFLHFLINIMFFIIYKTFFCSHCSKYSNTFSS